MICQTAKACISVNVRKCDTSASGSMDCFTVTDSSAVGMQAMGRSNVVVCTALFLAATNEATWYVGHMKDGEMNGFGVHRKDWLVSHAYFRNNQRHGIEQTSLDDQESFQETFTTVYIRGSVAGLYKEGNATKVIGVKEYRTRRPHHGIRQEYEILFSNVFWHGKRSVQ